MASASAPDASSEPPAEAGPTEPPQAAATAPEAGAGVASDAPRGCRAMAGMTLELEDLAEQCKATVTGGAFVGAGITVMLEAAKPSVRSGASDQVTLRFSNMSAHAAQVEVPVRFELVSLVRGTQARVGVYLSTRDAKGRSVDFPSNYGLLGMLGPHAEPGVRVVLEPHSEATATLAWKATGYLPDKRYSSVRGGSPPKDKLRPGRYTVGVDIAGGAGAQKVDMRIRVRP